MVGTGPSPVRSSQQRPCRPCVRQQKALSPRMILINRDTLEVSFEASCLAGALAVHEDAQSIDYLLDPLASLAYFSGAYSDAVDPAPRTGRSGRRVAAFKGHPDPWFIVLTAIMWEGILQGLSWELVKQAIDAALGKLKRRGLAPSDGTLAKTTSTRGATQLGFSYTTFAMDGAKQKELFLGYRRVFESKKEIERLLPTRPSEWAEMRRAHLAARNLRRGDEAGRSKGPAKHR